MVRFVSSDAVGLPLKRNHSQHACESCRRRKRRCTHSGRGAASQRGSSETQSRGDSRANPASRETSDTQENSASTVHLAGHEEFQNIPMTEPSKVQPSRFVGDLNPEGVFIEAISTATRDSSNGGGVGVWHSKGPLSRPDHLTGSFPPGVLQFTSIFQTDSAAHKVLSSYLQDQCLNCVPPVADFNVLKTIYLRKIHPIFPILGELTFRSYDTSPSTIILKQALSLAASTNADAANHLRLTPDGPLLTHQDFSQRLSSAMRAALDFGLITDKIVLIRSLALLSLYIQPSDASEGDLPALLNARVVHYVQTLGLQHDGYRDGLDSSAAESLFCATWALDRLNAAFYGRPVMIHENDIGRDLDVCFEKQQPCFQLFLKVVGWLDRIISLYRPKPTSSVTEMAIELPSFEDLILTAGAIKEADSTLAMIEIFYHAVSILSCRLSSPNLQTQSQISHSSVSKIRGSFSAARITSIIADEYHHQVPLLPVVPYALSLSLGVAYRELRHSKVPLYRGRAKAALKANCVLLGELGSLFRSASVMARMGEQVLEEMDKAIDIIAQVRQQGEQGEPGGEAHVDGHGTEAEESEQSGTIEIADDNLTYLDGNMFSELSEMDVFEHFDPKFDLDAIDTALGVSLDGRMPLNYGSWGNISGY